VTSFLLIILYNCLSLFLKYLKLKNIKIISSLVRLILLLNQLLIYNKNYFIIFFIKKLDAANILLISFKIYTKLFIK
jgi:hypothetical protein